MPTVHLSAAVEQYGAARATRYSSTTVKNEMSVLRRLVHNLGNPTVDKVTPGMIEGWFASVMKPHTDRIGIGREPVAASTANYYRTRIQSLQRYCTQRGWTTTDWLAHSPRMRQAKRTRQQPAVDLLLAMLDATTDPRNRAVLAVAMNTGLRSSEIGLLRVADVDLNTLTLRTWINKSLLEDEMPMTSDLARRASRRSRWPPSVPHPVTQPSDARAAGHASRLVRPVASPGATRPNRSGSDHRKQRKPYAMLAPDGCPLGVGWTDLEQAQSCRPTGAFVRSDPPHDHTNRWIRA